MVKPAAARVLGWGLCLRLGVGCGEELGGIVGDVVKVCLVADVHVERRLAISSLKTIWSMARTVVRVVIRMGRIRVLPVAIRAARRSMPPRRSWFA